MTVLVKAWFQFFSIVFLVLSNISLLILECFDN